MTRELHSQSNAVKLLIDLILGGKTVCGREAMHLGALHHDTNSRRRGRLCRLLHQVEEPEYDDEVREVVDLCIRHQQKNMPTRQWGACYLEVPL